MKKIILSILVLFFTSNIFSQNILTQIKDNYFEQFPKGKSHFFLKVNAVTYQDDKLRNLTNPTNDEILNNISIGYIINNNLIIGVNSINSTMDYREDGYNPVEDYYTIYGRNLFLEYNIFSSPIFNSIPLFNNNPILKNTYVSVHRPFSRIDNHDFTEIDATRAGVGIRYKVFKHLNLDMQYNQLVDPNINEGFEKGKLTFGVVVVL